MRVTVTIDVPDGFHHAIKPVAKMCGLYECVGYHQSNEPE